jgi:Tfp pilus assembly protein PilN
VTRFNYLIGWSERHAGVSLAPVLGAASRGPLIALACAFAVVFVSWALQNARLADAEARGAAYARRAAAAAPEVARARAVEREVARLRALAERVAAIRHAGAQRASEIAALGNRLPPDTSLTSLRVDRTALALEGRGERIEAVAAALTGLAGLPPYAGARLLSVREDPTGHGVTYALALDTRP